MKDLNDKILKATALFEENNDVAKFLRHVTFNETVENNFKERIEIGTEFEEDLDDEFNETIIPNTFREESNVWRCHPREATKRTKTDLNISSAKKKNK